MIYFTDLIKIVTSSKSKDGVITEVESIDIDARIKDNNKLVMNDKGQEVIGQMTIMIDKNKAVKYGDKIKVVKKWGVAYAMSDKKFVIHSIDNIGGFHEDIIRIEI